MVLTPGARFVNPSLGIRFPLNKLERSHKPIFQRLVAFIICETKGNACNKINSPVRASTCLQNATLSQTISSEFLYLTSGPKDVHRCSPVSTGSTAHTAPGRCLPQSGQVPLRGHAGVAGSNERIDLLLHENNLKLSKDFVQLCPRTVRAHVQSPGRMRSTTRRSHRTVRAPPSSASRGSTGVLCASQGKEWQPGVLKASKTNKSTRRQ